MKEMVMVEYVNTTAIIKLNRPEVFNSLNVGVAQSFMTILDEIENNSSVHSVVITGEGRAFCAGAELNQELMSGGSLGSAGEALNHNMEQYYNVWINRLTDFPKPIIVALNGVAAGAGVGLALAGDIIISAKSAYFILTFMPKLGLIPDMGSSWHLLKNIGWARSKALTLTGDRLHAQTAKEWGVVWQVVEDTEVMAASMQLAEQLSQLPAYAKHEINQLYRSALVNSLPEQLDYERIKQSELFGTAEFKEGVTAFMEKRAPQFKV